MAGERKGTAASGSTLRPLKKWCMAVLPTSKISSTGLPSANRASIAPTASRMRSVSIPGSARSWRIRLIRSAPKRAWGLSAVSTWRTVPVRRSTSWATSVVVPISTTAPRPSAGSNGTSARSSSTAIDHWAISRVTGPVASAMHPSRQPARELFGREHGAHLVGDRDVAGDDPDLATAALRNPGAGELDPPLEEQVAQRPLRGRLESEGTWPRAGHGWWLRAKSVRALRFSAGVPRGTSQPAATMYRGPAAS